MFLQIKPLLCAKTHCIEHPWHKPATPKTMQNRARPEYPEDRMMLTRRTESGRAQDGHAQDVLSILRVINNDRTRIRRSATVLSRCSVSTKQLHLSWGRVAPPRHSSSLPGRSSPLPPCRCAPQSSRQAPILPLLRCCYWQCLLRRRLPPPVFVSSGTFCIAVPPRKPKGVGSPKD